MTSTLWDVTHGRAVGAALVRSQAVYSGRLPECVRQRLGDRRPARTNRRAVENLEQVRGSATRGAGA
jgi:hypothetical protein